MPADVILTALLFLVAAGGFATAMLTAHRTAAGRLPPRTMLLALAYAGLALAALTAALWPWGRPVGLEATAARRVLAVSALLLLAVLVATISSVDAVRRGWGRQQARQDHEDVLAIQQLTAAAAHDLKGPLRTIHASATLLERRLAPRGMDREMLHHIKESAHRMTSMVDELLRYTQVANSAPTLQPVQFLHVAQAVDADLQAVIDERLASVEWRGGGTIHADSGLMRRALTNLVENAIKYGPEGGRVTVTAAPFLGGLRITVEDQGPGVPADERSRIFDVFQRGSNTAGVPGSGLGLATVAKVAQLHSGSVGVESDEGRGSRFWLWIPGLSDPRRKPVQAPDPIVANLPVLG